MSRYLLFLSLVLTICFGCQNRSDELKLLEIGYIDDLNDIEAQKLIENEFGKKKIDVFVSGSIVYSIRVYEKDVVEAKKILADTIKTTKFGIFLLMEDKK